ncbi:MAG: anhydro-N-acetylmuramic acid kinase, partial [Bacteroidota bacterium]
GQLARQGESIPGLQAALSALPYHHRTFPKSLANDWVVDVLWPLVNESQGSVKDKLYTFCQFLANQIHQSLGQACQQNKLVPGPRKVLVTGGGARNIFLLETLRKLPQDDQFPLGYEVPESPIGDLKEAAMVALSALHRTLRQSNVFASATGAKRDTVNGALYLP